MGAKKNAGELLDWVSREDGGRREGKVVVGHRVVRQ